MVCKLCYNTANANQVATFSITDAKLYVPVPMLSTQDNAKLLLQLKTCFKRTVKWNKYQSKGTIHDQLKIMMIEQVANDIFF